MTQWPEDSTALSDPTVARNAVPFPASAAPAAPTVAPTPAPQRGRARLAAQAEPLSWSACDSPVGPLLLLASPRGLCGLYMACDPHGPAVVAPAWVRRDATFDGVRRQLDEYFAGQRTRFEIALDLAGTPFQRAVWQALCAIPYGITISYGALAQRVGNAKAVRAVGLANGRNPVAIVVPCHRVIGASGALTGYGGGLDNKHRLLALEMAREPLGHLLPAPVSPWDRAP